MYVTYIWLFELSEEIVNNYFKRPSSFSLLSFKQNNVNVILYWYTYSDRSLKVLSKNICNEHMNSLTISENI